MVANASDPGDSLEIIERALLAVAVAAREVQKVRERHLPERSCRLNGSSDGISNDWYWPRAPVSPCRHKPAAGPAAWIASGSS